MTEVQLKNIALAKKWLKYFHRQYNEDDVEDVIEFALGLDSSVTELDIINYIRERYKKMRRNENKSFVDDMDSIPVEDENILSFEEEQYNQVLEKELDRILTKREKALFLYRLNKVPYKDLSHRFHLSEIALKTIYRKAVKKVRQKIDLDSL
jgi:hypothetical protein